MENATNGTTTGYWGVASDIKGGYTHLWFAHSSVTYTGVEIEGKVYAHVTVKFGNAPAPRVYTEVTAVMFHCKRMAGVYMTLYIDDRLMRAFLRHQLMQDALMTFILEATLGWAVSTEKVQAPSHQTVTWTGHEIHWHAQEPFLKIPEDKMGHARDNESKEEDPPQLSLSLWHTELIQRRWAVANIAFQQKRIMYVFGDKNTAKYERFISRVLCPGTSGIDGFTPA
eukprot:jgi/Tetstr1/462130/TSEL_007198.t1